MTQKITLIIPLRLTAGTHEGELRLNRLCATVPRDLYDILISDYGTEDAHAGPIRALEDDGVEIARHPSPGALFSIGHARDFGVQMARQKVILFNDIDFLASPEMYRQIHAEAVRRNIAVNMFDFFCVPVLFLTEAGTSAWFDAAGRQEPFVRRNEIAWLESAAADIQFTAFGSSAMLINRRHYLSLGGHDPNFAGHGAEDYDLLHRLASLAPRGPRPHDYFTDYKTNAVRHYWGFRPFFALYGLDVFARGIHLVHLWHPRRAEKGYFRPRQNFRLLEALMRNFDSQAQQPPPLADLHSSGRLVVFSRDRAATVLLFRQLLSVFGGYVMHELPQLPGGDEVTAIARREKAGWILLDLYPQADAAAMGAALFSNTGSNVLVAVRGEGMLTVMRISNPVSEPFTTPIHAVRSPENRLLMQYPERLALAGLPVLESGVRPAMAGMQSPIFASFGGAQALDSRLHSKPAARRKTRWWIRLHRWLTRG